MKRMVKKAGDLDKLAESIQQEDAGTIFIAGDLNVEGVFSANGEIYNERFNITVPFTSEEVVASINGQTKKDVSIEGLADFIRAQNGSVLSSLVTPIGTIALTLTPCIWGGGTQKSYQGVFSIDTNLTSVGGNLYNIMFVSLVVLDGSSVPYITVRIVPVG